MAAKASDPLADDLDFDDEDTVDDSDDLLSEKKLFSSYDKIDARRKIELYWEKRRLREEFGDIEDFDLNF